MITTLEFYQHVLRALEALPVKSLGRGQYFNEITNRYCTVGAYITLERDFHERLRNSGIYCMVFGPLISQLMGCNDGMFPLAPDYDEQVNQKRYRFMVDLVKAKIRDQEAILKLIEPTPEEAATTKEIVLV